MNAIRFYREKTGMSQKQFAKKAKVSLSFFNLLENGKGNPSWHILFKIARALHVSPEQLTIEMPPFEEEENTEEPVSQLSPENSMNALRYYRQCSGMKQTELAKIVGVTRQHISFLEHKTYNKRYSPTLAKIADALAIPVNYLIKKRVAIPLKNGKNEL